MLGTYVLSSGYYDAYYQKSLRAREFIKNDFNEAFQKVDLLLSPTSPSQAFKIGERMTNTMTMYLSDMYTTAANLAEIPAISVPCRVDQGVLPIGLQLMSNKNREKLLFEGAYCFEKATKQPEKE